MGKTVDQLLADNLNRLMSSPTSSLKTNVAVGRRSGIGQATVDRARNNHAGLSIAKVEALARAFNLEAWQLLAPDLGEKVIATNLSGHSWPFKDILPRDFASLSINDVNLVEERIRTLVEKAAHQDRQT